MKKFILAFVLALASAGIIAPPTCRAQAATPTPTPVVTVVKSVDGGGTTQTPVAITAGQVFTVDAQGNPVAYTLPTVLAQRAGLSTATSVSLTRTITFATAMPSANYAIGLGQSSLTGSILATYSNRTATGFVINFSLATSTPVDWTATQTTQ